MTHSRTLPLLGPCALVLYLVADLASTGAAWTAALWVTAVTAPALALVPALVFSVETRRWLLGLLGLSLALTLLGDHVPAASPLVAIASALGQVAAGSILVDLAWTTPDRWLSTGRLTFVRLLYVGSALVVGLVASSWVFGSTESVGPYQVLDALTSAEHRWWFLAEAWLLASALVALTIRFWRQRTDQSARALAADRWALFALGLAIPLIACRVWMALAQWSDNSVTYVVSPLLGFTLLAGHGLALDPRFEGRSGRGIRVMTRVIVTLLVALGVVGLAQFARGFQQVDAAEVVWLCGAVALLSVVAYGGLAAVLDSWLAPFRGRLLKAVVDARRQLPGCGSLTELAAVLLPALRKASGDPSATPYLYVYDPGHEVRVDLAGVPRVRTVELPQVFSERFLERGSGALVSRVLEQHIVTDPNVRPLVQSLADLDAEAAVAICHNGELEGVLLLPKGARRSALTLEELEALDELARAIAGPLSVVGSQLRAAARTQQAEDKQRELREDIDALEDEVARLKSESARWQRGAPGGQSPSVPPASYAPSLRSTQEKADRIAALSAPVMLVAEPGIDTIAFARRIHERGGRASAPFVIGDCRAVPPSEAGEWLFGLSDSSASQPGWLSLASAGSLCLLDISALPRQVQGDLVEVFSTHEAIHADGLSRYTTDARVIATVPLPIATLVERGTLDPELARWLQESALHLPPLRDRREDLESLLWVAIDRACRVLGREVVGVSPDALKQLKTHDWPGNEQELQWVVSWAAARAEGSQIQPDDLPPLVAGADRGQADPLNGSLREVEERLLVRALDRARGNKSEAARMVGLKRSTFLDKLKRHGLADAG